MQRINKISKYIIILIILCLVGCSWDDSGTSYKEIEFELVQIDLLNNLDLDNTQIGEFYNNDLNFTNLNSIEGTDIIYDTGIGSVSLKDNLINEKTIHDENSKRVWGSIIIDESNTLYCIIDLISINDRGLLKYEIIHQNGNQENVITVGYTYNIFGAPVFKVLNDNIYFTIKSYDHYDDNINWKYRCEFWEFKENKAQLIEQTIGDYADYSIGDDTVEYLKYYVDINENSISFLSEQNNQVYLNHYSDNKLIKNLIKENTKYAISFGDYYLCAAFVMVDGKVSDLENYLFDKNTNTVVDIDHNKAYYDYVSLSENIAVAIGRDMKTYILQYSNGYINEIVLENLNTSYFRRINNASTLIFSRNEGDWEIYKLEIKN